MTVKNISLSDLIVNPNNDRHGPTGSEKDAIDWLFSNKQKEMLNLADRITSDGRIFDIPLVVPSDKKFLVMDGNRRVTCLKLLNEPKLAPTHLQGRFQQLKEASKSKMPFGIDCQIEVNQEVADQITFLRHNGTQSGIGQLNWGLTEKANHANRVSGSSDYQWPQLAEKTLQDAGYSEEAAMIKRSTLDRVLKVKKRRERLGIEIGKDGLLQSTSGKGDIVPLLKKFAHDMDQGRLTLKNTLQANDVDAYLDGLAVQGFQFHANTSAKKSSTIDSTQVATKTKKIAKKKKRQTLIPQVAGYHPNWGKGDQKIQLAFEQLQYELSLRRHKFSIAVMLRVLLELSLENYLRSKNKTIKQKLVDNVRSSCISLREDGELEKSIEQDIIRNATSESSTLSIRNIQRFVHANSQMPTEDDLRTIWDCYEPLILGVLPQS